MAARVRVGTRLDPDTELPRIAAWAREQRRTVADSIRFLALEALDKREGSRSVVAERKTDQ